VSGVAVVIPYKSDGGGYRDHALTWIVRWWAAQHPTWPVIIGHCVGEWCKAVALADGLTRVDPDTREVVVADADMLTDGVQAAVDAVRDGHPWAVPHARLHRLTREATATILDSPPARPAHWTHLPTHETPYTGVAGGSMTVFARAVLEEVPMPPIPRWGQQDQAHAEALTTLVGPYWRGTAPICHLWHPPPQRLSRKWGSLESRAWYARYVEARGKPEQMRAVIDEDRARLAETITAAATI
jgi:hypothetical protein